MSLLDDCKEIAAIAEENADFKIKYNKIVEVIKQNTVVVKDICRNSDFVLEYKYETIGEKVVEIIIGRTENE